MNELTFKEEWNEKMYTLKFKHTTFSNIFLTYYCPLDKEFDKDIDKINTNVIKWCLDQ